MKLINYLGVLRIIILFLALLSILFAASGNLGIGIFIVIVTVLSWLPRSLYIKCKLVKRTEEKAGYWRIFLFGYLDYPREK